MSDRQRRLVWIDIQTSGDDPSVASIRRLAIVVTDENLAVVAAGPELAVDDGPEAIAEAETATAAFIAEHCDPGTAPLCGDLVWKDKEFLDRWMPAVVALLHYRIVDVATIRELVRRWFPADATAPERTGASGSREDIAQSIRELSFYRSRVFKP